MTLASAERAAICDAFAQAGPAQATLCGDWTTRDLLVHLLVRERQPWAAGGILLSPLKPITDLAGRSWARTPYPDMIATLRGGAPIWSPFCLPKVDEMGNGAEMFVHHEDVRRGVPGWAPRDPDPTRDAQVWEILVRMGKALHRHSEVGVVLRTPAGREHVAKAGPGVTVVGEPGELLLHAFGRDEVQVQVEGSPADVAAFTKAARGF